MNPNTEKLSGQLPDDKLSHILERLEQFCALSEKIFHQVSWVEGQTDKLTAVTQRLFEETIALRQEMNDMLSGLMERLDRLDRRLDDLLRKLDGEAVTTDEEEDEWLKYKM